MPTIIKENFCSNVKTQVTQFFNSHNILLQIKTKQNYFFSFTA